MDESTREKIALFRFSIIAPVLNGQVPCQSRHFEEAAQKSHEIPHYGLREYTPKTFFTWLSKYRKHGFPGLKPCTRNDKDSFRSVGSDMIDHLVSLRKENEGLSISLLYEKLIDSVEIIPAEISFATFYRIMRKHGVVRKNPVLSHQRKRFAHDRINMLWQGDISDGPYLNTVSGKKKTYLFAFIDDCSRLIVNAEYFFSEKFDSLKKVLKQALLIRGIPKMIYTDNGKVYHSDGLKIACAELGIVLIHAKPYDSQAKGKIERFFGTVRTSFLQLLKQEPAKSLEELNRRFGEWLEKGYNRKIHSSLDGKTPLDTFTDQSSHIKMIDDPEFLERIFLKRVARKVRQDGTVSIDNVLYEAPPEYILQPVEIRFDERCAFIYVNGIRKEKVIPVKYADNALAKRSRIFYSDHNDRR